ncbi:MAG TPA: hypothetical protein PKD79_03365 [Candidatus Doudnabacteria bacterium]|nr:hypothetical protein [Candidatus Doudnabacteria bacterium]
MGTKIKCLDNEQVTYKARGHELWKAGEEHLKECVGCAKKVAEEAEAFVLSEASQPPQTETKTANKMGKSHNWYLGAISSRV